MKSITDTLLGSIQNRLVNKPENGGSKIVIILLAAIPLCCLVPAPYSYFILVVLSAACFVKKNPVSILAIASTFSLFVILPTEIVAFLDRRALIENIQLAQVYMPILLAVVCVALFVYLYIKAVQKINFIKRNSTLLLVLILLISLAIYSNFESRQPLIWSFLFIISKLIWHIALIAKDARQNKRPLNEQIISLYPVWFVRPNPIPYYDSVEKLFSNLKTNPSELFLVRWKGLKLLYWSLILAAIEMILGHILLGRHTGYIGNLFLPQLGFPDLQVTNLHLKELVEQFPAWKLWIGLVTGVILLHLRIAWGGGVAIGTLRLCGIYAWRNTYRIIEARSFFDFMVRISHYYVNIIAQLFFYPIFFHFFKKQKSLRVFFSIFVGTLIGGSLYRIFIHAYEIPKMDEVIIQRMVLVFFMYYGMLGASMGLSAMVSYNNRKKKLSSTPKLLRPVAYYIFYALISIPNLGFLRVPLTEHWMLLLKLFHLG